jgi:ACR3 family arsenite efflux pump ArsB
MNEMAKSVALNLGTPFARGSLSRHFF